MFFRFSASNKKRPMLIKSLSKRPHQANQPQTVRGTHAHKRAAEQSVSVLYDAQGALTVRTPCFRRARPVIETPRGGRPGSGAAGSARQSRPTRYALGEDGRPAVLADRRWSPVTKGRREHTQVKHACTAWPLRTRQGHCCYCRSLLRALGRKKGAARSRLETR